jgi:putative phosphonate metabolism protein
MGEPRFAIFFVPPTGSDLYRFGAGFLGYDCYSGADLGYRQDAEIGASEWAELTREPRRYGFHATLKAPFHLVPTLSEDDLLNELRRFAALPRPVPVIEPVVQSLGRFIAIVPADGSTEVDRLAADCVTAFDRFRRPLSLEERSKRLAAGLNEHQAANLDQWGYPYVFDDFRFHMTLTGPVDAGRRAAIFTILQARMRAICRGVSLPISRIALLRQDAASAPFRLVCQAALTSLS